jgi:kumamolisin
LRAALALEEKSLIRKFSLSVLALAAVVSFVSAQSFADAQAPLTHHVRVETTNGSARLIGHKAASDAIKLDIVLNLSDPEGLKAFVADIYNPSSPNYKHYLTPAQFTERFGPSQSDWDTLLAWAKSQGLEVTGGSRDGFDLQLKGNVTTVEKAFHVTLNNYQDPDGSGRTLFAADREPSLDLPFQVWHVTGLNNFYKPHTRLSRREDYAKAHGISPDAVVTHATTGSGPSASFLGSDMRAAYYGGTALTGAGQHLGLFEYLGTDLADLNTYYTNVHQTLPITPLIYSTDGSSTNCIDSDGCDDTEQTLDMTQILGMAPGMATLVMYVSTTSDTAILSAMTVTNTTTPYLPTTIGCSWGWTPDDPSSDEPYWEKMSAQGQTFFAASGDNGTWASSAGKARAEAWPADDPYIISVGGTDLTTSSAAGPWNSETAWSTSGGGVNKDSIAIPAYQQLTGVVTSANKASSTLRNGPDVAANANYTFYTCADQTTCLANEYGGTSFAAPMWAGYIALLNQQLAAEGRPTMGFFNPAIYPLGLGSGYATAFHDITSGKVGSNSAGAGYDLTTGWGSPNGTGLITALDAATLTMTPTTGTTATSFGADLAYPGFDGTATVYYALGSATPTSLGTCTETSSVLNSCTYTFTGSKIGPGPYNMTGQLVWVEVGSGTTSSYTSKTTASSPITIIDTTTTSGIAIPSSILTTTSTSINVKVADSVTSTFTPTAETITLQLGSTTLTTCTLVAGTCTATVNGSQLALGSNTIKLSYPGATNYYDASSGTVTVMVSAPAADATTTSVSASPTSITTAQTTVLTAVVKDTTNTGTTPTGSVTFNLGTSSGTLLGSCTLSAGSCSSSAISGATLGVGTPTVVASYAGVSGTYAASSGSTGVTVSAVASNVITFSSTTHNFGTVAVGTAATAYTLQVKNTGTTAYPFVLNFTPANGFTSATNCPASIAAGGTCEIAFYFTPTATGTVTDTWSLTAENGFTYSPSNGGTLTGGGTSQGGLSLSTAGHNWGTVTTGTTSAAYGVTLSNSTSSAVTLTLGSVTSPFASQTNCGATLAAGASCQFSFTFTPTSSATVSQTYSISAGGVTITSGGNTVTGIVLTGN